MARQGMIGLPDWREMGACWKTDSAPFFPPAGKDKSVPAKQLCAKCCVADECLGYALDLGLKHGVWGGTTEKTRRKIRRGTAVLGESPNTTTTNIGSQGKGAAVSLWTTPRELAEYNG